MNLLRWFERPKSGDTRVWNVAEAEKQARSWEELFNEEAAERRERAACHRAGQEYDPLPAWIHKRD